jgi:MoaD family protein
MVALERTHVLNINKHLIIFLRFSMNVEVRYYTILREITEKRFEKISIHQSSTVKDLINYLVEKYDNRFASYVYNSKKEFRKHLSYLLNGVNIHNLQGFDTSLNENDIVSFLPQVGGG